MTIANILGILKSDLGEPNATQDRVTFLTHEINVAVKELTVRGVRFNPTASGTPEVLDYPIEDAELIERYAAWLIRNRANGSDLDRDIQYAINCRVLSKQEQDKVTTNV